MRLKDCQSDWFEYKNIQVRKYLTNVNFKGESYEVWIYKCKDQNLEKHYGAFFKRVNNKNIVLISLKPFQLANKDEINAIIKHEMIHRYLRHRNHNCSISTYIKKHEEVYKLMTKKELINQTTLNIKVAMS